MAKRVKFATICISAIALISISACAIKPGILNAISSNYLPALTKYSSDIKSVKNNDKKDEQATDNSNACVVLVHGLWRSAFAMKGIQEYLNEQNYHTINISYPSTELGIEAISRHYLTPAVDQCSLKKQKVHLVTHSMGGIVARAYLKHNRLPHGSRVVMLSPPNQGSEFSLAFQDSALFSLIAGPAALTLHQEEGGYLTDLRSFPEPLGIIAAYRDWSLWPTSWLPSPNDGIVSVKSMMLEGMDDLVFVNSGHAMMRFRRDVKEHILSFLQNGHFKHPKVL